MTIGSGNRGSKEHETETLPVARPGLAARSPLQYSRPEGASGTTRVWKFEKNYEDHLRASITEAKYQELSQKYAAEAGCSKPVKARLIATERGVPVPPVVEEILRWSMTQSK